MDKLIIPHITFTYLRVWLIMFLILGVVFTNLLLKNDITIYVSYIGVVKDTNQVSLIVPIDKLNSLLKENKIVIDNKDYKYKVIKINEDTIVESTKYYKEIILNISLSQKQNINNNILKIKILKEEKNLFRILESLWKE